MQNYFLHNSTNIKKVNAFSFKAILDMRTIYYYLVVQRTDVFQKKEKENLYIEKQVYKSDRYQNLYIIFNKYFSITFELCTTIVNIYSLKANRW